jgi:hypothetical protein
MRVAGIEGWGACSGRPRTRAPAVQPRKAGRGSRDSAIRLRRWPAAAASFPPAQVLRRCSHRCYGCRRRCRRCRRCRHCRRPLCLRHPRRRPRRHLGRAASAA